MFKRTDNNQKEIVDALRKAGASVQSLASQGHGTPDILCGFRKNNYLFEVKNENGKLTEDERLWHLNWNGEVHIIRTSEEALKIIGAIR